MGARFSAPVQTGPGAHPASCTMGTWSIPGVKGSRCMTLTLQPLLVPWSWMGRAIPLLPLWAIRPVQSLSACTRVHFTLPLWPINVTKTNQLRHIQQNSFNPPSTNLEIQKIQHWRYFLDWKFWFCQKKRFVIETSISEGHISKGLQECMYIRHCGFSFLLHQLLLLWRPWWPRTSRWRRYPNGIVPWLVIQPKYGSSNKQLLAIT